MIRLGLSPALMRTAAAAGEQHGTSHCVTAPAVSRQVMQHAFSIEQNATWCRWYSILVGSDVCKIDLVDMLNATESNKHPLFVWHKWGLHRWHATFAKLLLISSITGSTQGLCVMNDPEIWCISMSHIETDYRPEQLLICHNEHMSDRATYYSSKGCLCLGLYASCRKLEILAAVSWLMWIGISVHLALCILVVLCMLTIVSCWAANFARNVRRFLLSLTHHW